jgi:hypothetical protein
MPLPLPQANICPATGRQRRLGSNQFNPYADGLPQPPSPLFLPFKIQHIFYNTIQKLLEEACFHFASRHCPDLLRTQGWDTPEAGEFNQWWTVIKGSSIPKQFVKVSPGLNVQNLFTRLHTGKYISILFRRLFNSMSTSKAHSRVLTLEATFSTILRTYANGSALTYHNLSTTLSCSSSPNRDDRFEVHDRRCRYACLRTPRRSQTE